MEGSYRNALADMTAMLKNRPYLLGETPSIADYVYVLELGRNRFEGPVEEFTDLKKAFWV